MILGFGEIMMRVCPPGFGRFRQCLPGSVDVTFGGGEANVCGSLALLGRPVRYLTALLQAIEKARAQAKHRKTVAEAEEWLAELDLSGDLQQVRRKMARYVMDLRG